MEGLLRSAWQWLLVAVTAVEWRTVGVVAEVVAVVPVLKPGTALGLVVGGQCNLLLPRHMQMALGAGSPWGVEAHP